MLRWWFGILASATLTFGEPFWRAKEKLYERIRNGEIIVSVKTVDPVPPKANRMAINGGGQVRVPAAFLYTFATDWEKAARLSGFIDKVSLHPDGKAIDIEGSSMGYKAELTVGLKAEKDIRKLEFEILKGPMAGMRSRLVMTEVAATTSGLNPSGVKTEVGIDGEYQYDQFPLPRFFLQFGLEVIFQKMATRMRNEAEAAFKGGST